MFVVEAAGNTTPLAVAFRKLWSNSTVPAAAAFSAPTSASAAVRTTTTIKLTNLRMPLRTNIRTPALA